MAVVPALFLSAGLAKADSIKSVLRDFSLVGTWSEDCSLPTDVCNPPGDAAICAVRVTFEVPLLLSPTRTTVWTRMFGMAPWPKKVDITSAWIVNNKLAYTHVVQGQATAAPRPLEDSSFPDNGETWTQTLEKVGEKMRVLHDFQTNGPKRLVVDGYESRPVDREPYKVPIDWRNTGHPAPVWERCN
jgi:hypothetical protein